MVGLGSWGHSSAYKLAFNCNSISVANSSSMCDSFLHVLGSVLVLFGISST